MIAEPWDRRAGGPWSRRSSEQGLAVPAFVLGVAALILPLSIIVVSLPTWLEVQSMGRMAAQQAARAAVLAPSAASAEQAARQAAETVVANHGRALRAPVRLEGSLTPGGDDGPQESITATVTVRMPALALPLVGEATGLDWEVSHAQPVDLYRSVQ